MTPRLSVIIPVLDEAASVAATLAPLQTLRAQGHEVILVDGGSTDATCDLAAPLCDLVISAPRGRASQMNAGASSARGDILLFLHADTRLPDNAASLVIDRLDGSGGTWGRFDVAIEGKPKMLGIIAFMMNLRSRVTGIATGDQAIFVRKDAFRAVGGFPDQRLMEDIAFSAIMKRQRRPLCLRACVATSGRRWEKNGVWRTILLMWSLRAGYYFGADPEELAVRYGYDQRPR
jgi:rSAM/selenodomain-associated transferase 2